MSSRGLTLIELIVAVTLFSIIIVVIFSIFVSSVKLQRYSLSYQYLLDQGSYVMEYTSRFIRMAKKNKDTPTTCCSSSGPCLAMNANYLLTRSGNGLLFRNYENNCREIYYDATNKRLKLWEAETAKEYFFTSPKIQIASFKINLVGENQPPADTRQPRVTIFLEMQSVGQGSQPKIQLQTTFSQRDLDVEE